MNLNQSVCHLWDGVDLIGACIYNKSLNSPSATPPLHTCKQLRIIVYSLTEKQKSHLPSHFTFLRGSADVCSRPERQRCCRDQVQVCRSEPGTTTTSKILQREQTSTETPFLSASGCFSSPPRAADLLVRFRQLGGGAARRAERSCASLWPLLPPVRASATSRLTGADGAEGRGEKKGCSSLSVS